MRIIPFHRDPNLPLKDQHALHPYLKGKFEVVLSLSLVHTAIFSSEAAMRLKPPEERTGITCIVIGPGSFPKIRSFSDPLQMVIQTTMHAVKGALDIAYASAQRALQVFKADH